MENYSSIVQEALATFNNVVVPREQEEQGKSQLLRKAGYLINLRNPNIGYLKKTTGNQVHDMSVDILMDRTDGTIADCASSQPDNDGLVRITAVWVPNNNRSTDAAWLERWVKPTEELANLPGPMAGGSPVAPPRPDPIEPGRPDPIGPGGGGPANPTTPDLMLEVLRSQHAELLGVLREIQASLERAGDAIGDVGKIFRGKQ